MYKHIDTIYIIINLYDIFHEFPGSVTGLLPLASGEVLGYVSTFFSEPRFHLGNWDTIRTFVSASLSQEIRM